MYYVEPKESDSIEMQNAMTESQVIDMARNYYTEDIVTNMVQAIQILNKNGYMVFEDC
jgi:hypothetical protein